MTYDPYLQIPVYSDDEDIVQVYIRPSAIDAIEPTSTGSILILRNAEVYYSPLHAEEIHSMIVKREE